MIKKLLFVISVAVLLMYACASSQPVTPTAIVIKPTTPAPAEPKPATPTIVQIKPITPTPFEPKLVTPTIVESTIAAPMYAEAQPVVNADEEGCIPPLYDVAFPVVTHTPGLVTPRKIPPQGKWQIWDDLPFADEDAMWVVSRPQKNELWLRFGSTTDVYRYSIEKKQWKIYPVDFALYLFATNNGEIWSDKSLEKDSDSLLIRFNDATERFEAVPDASGLLRYPQIKEINSNIAEDQSDLLWFIASDTLYSFDLSARKSQAHYSHASADGPVAVGTDGSIWFVEFSEDRLVRYDPSLQQVRYYEAHQTWFEGNMLPFDIYSADGLYFDRSGKLWLNSDGWLDFSNGDWPVWYQIIDSPLFITDDSLPYSEYRLYRPYINFQSSNGWYWFTTWNGIIRLDLQAGKWCLVTTYRSNVVEDGNRNLWVAVSGHLYKYDLQAE